MTSFLPTPLLPPPPNTTSPLPSLPSTSSSISFSLFTASLFNSSFLPFSLFSPSLNSSFSFFISFFVFSHFFISGGMSSGVIVRSEDTTTRRSMRFSSSRTFPGQSYLSSRSIALFEIAMLRPYFLLNFSRKCPTRGFISSFLSLSGGIVMGTTLSR